MAKSFNQLPSPQRSVPAIPVSEMDFFALRENLGVAEDSDPLPTVEPALLPDLVQESRARESQAVGNTGNSVNTRNRVNPDKPLLTGNKTPKKKASIASNTSNTDNGSNSGNSVKTSNSHNTAELTSPLTATPEKEEGGVRQTFVLSRSHLEQLRDYVHARRAGGDYHYSQKQALQQALDLLFTTSGTASPRPSQAREREEQHRERIRQGRLAQNDKDR